MIGASLEFEWSADMKSKVRGRLFQDFTRGNGYPRAIDLYLVVVIDLSSLGGATIGKIAARAFGIGALERLVKATMPLVMIVTEIAFLCHCSVTPKCRKHNTQRHDEVHAGVPPQMCALPSK